MAKLLTIKIKDNNVDIKSHLPEGMSEAEVNDHLTTALPMAVAALAMELAEGCKLAGRAAVLSMFEQADDLLGLMMGEEDGDDCCAEGDDFADDNG